MKIQSTEVLSGRSWYHGAMAAAMGVVLLCCLSIPLLHAGPLYDELLHILAARGLLAEGSPVIAGGHYDRAVLFTYIVAGSFSIFGDSLWAARLPSLVFAAALVGLLSLWATRRQGFIAGACAACFLAMSPMFVSISVFARFYAFHALMIGVALMALFNAVTMSGSKRMMAIALTIASMIPAALVAREITLIVLIALMVAAAGTLTVDSPYLRRVQAARPARLAAISAAICIIGLAGSYIVWRSGVFEHFRSAPYWATRRMDNAGYYLGKFGSESPLFWPLLLPSVLVLFAVNRRLAAYLTLFVATTLTIHSAAGPKHLRYVAYIWPWACAILGCAAAFTVHAGAGFLRERAWCRVGGIGALAVLGVVVAMSNEGRRAIAAIAGDSGQYNRTEEKDPSWKDAIPVVNDLLRPSDKLVVSNSMKALYFLGHYDYELSATILRETDTGREFGYDLRTGKQVVSSPESLQRIIEQAGRVVLVIEDKKMGHFSGVTSDVVVLIEEKCKVASRVPGSALTIWTCLRP